jgi:hypothetical protein
MHYLLQADLSKIGGYLHCELLKDYNLGHPDAIPKVMMRIPKAYPSEAELYPERFGTIQPLTVKPIHIPDLITLSSKSKWADLLTIVQISSPFKVVSQRFWDIVSTFKHSLFETFPVKVALKGKVRDYVIIVQPEAHIEPVDYANSTFYYQILGGKGVEPIHINSHEEFINKFRALPPRHWIVNSKPCIVYDKIPNHFCRVRYIVNYLVSEELRHALESANIVGVKFDTPDVHGYTWR